MHTAGFGSKVSLLNTGFPGAGSSSDNGSIYYAMAIIWPQMVAVLYTDDGGASMYAAWLSCAPSVMINFGQIVAGFLAEPIGKTKLQCISVLVIGGALLGGESLVLRVTPVEQIC
jgi:MFS family permease